MATTYKGYVEISKLIAEIKKEGRECLYDSSCPDYKNNYKKQKLWAEIAEVVAIDKNACQAKWRSIRTKYRLVLSKQKGKSGSGCSELKPMAKFLLREMNFFRKYVETLKPQKKKRSKVTEATKEFERSEKKLDEYSAILKNRVELDPYFLTLQKEMTKVPENKQNALKLQILGLIYEAQEQESVIYVQQHSDIKCET